MARNRLDFEVNLEDRTRGPARSAERNIERIGDQSHTALGRMDSLGGGGAAALGKIGPAAGVAAGAVLGVVAAAVKATQAFGRMIDSVTRSQRELLFLAESSGIGIESLSVWAVGFEELGGTADDAAMAIREVSARIGETVVAMGEGGSGGEPGEALRALNLDAQELLKLDPAEQVRTVITALNGVGNESLRSALANQLLSDQYAEQLPILSRVAADYENIARAAADSGRVVTEAQAEQAVESQRTWNRFLGRFKGAAQEITAAVLPHLTSVLDAIAAAWDALADPSAHGRLTDRFGDTAAALGALKDAGWQLNQAVRTQVSSIRGWFRLLTGETDERLAALRGNFGSTGAAVEALGSSASAAAQGPWQAGMTLFTEVADTAFSFLTESVANALVVVSGGMNLISGVLVGDMELAKVGLLQVLQGMVNQVLNTMEAGLKTAGQIGAGMLTVFGSALHALSGVEFTVKWPKIRQTRGLYSVPELGFVDRTFKPFGGLAQAGTNIASAGVSLAWEADQDLNLPRVTFGSEAAAAYDRLLRESVFGQKPADVPQAVWDQRRSAALDRWGDELGGLVSGLPSGRGDLVDAGWNPITSPAVTSGPGNRLGPGGYTQAGALQIIFNTSVQVPAGVTAGEDFADAVKKVINENPELLQQKLRAIGL